MSKGRCPECGGDLALRQSGFYACRNCGKLVIVSQRTEKQEVEAAKDMATAFDADIPGGLVIPDFPNELIGWRAWGVKDPPLGEVPILRSVTHGGGNIGWEPGVRMEARCRKHGLNAKRPHNPPEERCTCGLYSAKTREHLQSMDYHQYDAERRGLWRVMGEVSIWGKVIEGTQGWRSEYGYPRVLYVPYEAHHLVAPLRAAYGCKVELDNILATKEA